MDRLPLTKLHKSLWLVCTLAWFFDGFENTTASAMLPFLYPEFHLTVWSSALVLSGAFWGQFVGSYALGYLADRWGRRKVFQIDLLVYSIFGGLRMFALSWIDLIAYTIISNIGISGLYSVDNAYMSEYLPPKSRGNGRPRWSSQSYPATWCLLR
jgi:putative MFS transporter